MKKVIVASFQRSGTHFLINNFATNFEGIEDGWVDIVHGRNNQWVKDVNRRNLVEKIREQLVDAYHPHPSNKCMKTHFQMYFLERNLDAILDKYDIFYILRDPRDTMVACYHYYNNTNFECFIKEPDFSKFLRSELWEVQTELQPFSYSYVKPRNIIDKWNKHVLSWLHYKDKGVTFVRFEDLKYRLVDTLKYMAARSRQRLKPVITPVGVGDKRYRPDFNDPALKRGEAGVWRDFFKNDDLDFLNSFISGEIKSIVY